MSSQFRVLFVAATLLFTVLDASSASSAQDKKINAPPLQFSYMGTTGPAHWGSLNPAFSTCSTGKLQSPVDIITAKVIRDDKLKPLKRKYTSINATLVNNGFNIGLRCGQTTGFLISDDKVHTFRQMHWHSPSEHKVNGLQYAAELHMVHIADDGHIVVISVLYQLGHADPLIAKIEPKLRQLAKSRFKTAKEEPPQIAVGEFNMHQLKKDSHRYYRYLGSLTSPPCNETITWYILGKVRSISGQQLKALRAPLDWACRNNARPTQPLHGRPVELYIEKLIS